MKPLIIYWCRRDFRLHDNPALHTALQESVATTTPFTALFIVEDYMREDTFNIPARTLLSEMIAQHSENIPHFSVVTAKAAEYFTNLAKHHTLHIHVNEDIHPDFFKQIKKIQSHNITITVHTDRLTINKNTVSGTGNHYSVFTPFKHAVWQEFVQSTVTPTVTNTLLNKAHWHTTPLPHSVSSIAPLFSKKVSLYLPEHTEAITLPVPNFDTSSWYSSEQQALHLCDTFIKQHITSYKDRRDILSDTAVVTDATSHLSIGLAWGLISARTILQKIFAHHSQEEVVTNDSISTFISELIWREFYGYLFYHNTSLLHTAFQKKYHNTIAWRYYENPTEAELFFVSWIQGATGYPIVDAAMQEIAHTGWMHNRSRMVVASILTKNLGIDWRWGQAYFQLMLADIDEASNNGGWQWGASVGADPKPIRIFNPSLQAERFDPEGWYQKKWLPETYFLPGGPSSAPLIPHEQARFDALRRYGLSE